MGYCDAAQAVELVRALRHQLHDMTTRLAWVECQDVAGRRGRAARMEAAELRRDIQEAEVLIDRLHRLYLNGTGTNKTRIHSCQAVRPVPVVGDAEPDCPSPRLNR